MPIKHCALQLAYKSYAHMHGKYTKLFLKPTMCKTAIERGSSWYAVIIQWCGYITYLMAPF